MNKRNRLIFIAIATIIAVACACPMTSLPTPSDPTPISNIPIPTIEIPTLPPINVPTGNVLLEDDFSSDKGEWEIFSDEVEGSADITNGVYQIKTLANLWLWGRTETSFTDTVAQFDVTFTSGPSNSNAGAGIYCRLNVGENTSLNAYMLAISADGYYAILDFIDGSPTALVDWTYSDAINQGYNTNNNIRATCNGNELAIEVNGEQLASTNIPAGGATSGYLSLAAVSFETAEPSAEAHFDNIIVTEP